MKKDCHPFLILNSHGKAIGPSFYNCLKEIQYFLTKNSREFIVLKIRSGKCKFENFIKIILLRYIKKCFGDIIVTQEDFDSWFNIETVSMKEIWNHNKNLLIYFDDNFLESFKISLKNDKNPSKDKIHNFLLDNGMFQKEKISDEYNFRKSNSKELIKEINNSLNFSNKKKLRIQNFTFVASTKFRLSFIIKIPTIYSLENHNFLKNNEILSYLIDCIYNSKDINVGNLTNFQLL